VRGSICQGFKSSFQLVKIILSTRNGILSIVDLGEPRNDWNIIQITSAWA
jgi:hypothetical protein